MRVTENIIETGIANPSSKQWLFAVFFEGREDREGGEGGLGL
jgi:hypothetical protein